MFSPREIMALGLSDPPGNVHLCEHGDDSNEGCSQADAADADPLVLNLIWRKPSNTGGYHPDLVKIEHYEVEVLRLDGTSSLEASLNFTEDALGVLYAERGLARVALTGLPKGQPLGARVRVRNFLGVGAWNSTPDDSPRIPLSLPSAPQLNFVGSGGELWSDAGTTSAGSYRPFLSVLFDPSQDFGTGIGQNVSLATIKECVYVFHISTSPLFEPATSWEAKFYPDPYTLNRRSQSLSWKIAANSSTPVEFGIKYFVRLRTQTVKGYSNWSLALNRTLLKTPGPATRVNLTIAGPMALKLSWAAPADFGAGDGRVYPLRGYQIVFQTAAGPPNLTSTNSIVFELLDFQTKVEQLQKGVLYFAHVRVQNEAIEVPGQFEPGFGPWTAATGQCADGTARSTICGRPGLLVIGSPTVPMSFSLKPVGDGLLLGSWSQPVDSGNGSSSYPLIRYELQFADDDAFTSNVETVYVFGDVLEHRTRHEIGVVKFTRIRAVNDVNTSAWSIQRSAQVLLLPSVPQNVTIANRNMSILLEYAAPIQTGLGPSLPYPLLTYEVRVNSSCPSDLGEKTITIQHVSFQNVSVQGLIKGCSYSFRVRAQNLAGWSAFSTPLIETVLSLSTAPTDLLVKPAAALELQVSWHVPRDTGDGQDRSSALVLQYRVDISNSPSFDVILRQIDTDNTNITIDLLPRNLLYCRVAALTRVGRGDVVISSAIPMIPSLPAVAVSISSNVTGANSTAMISFTTISGIKQHDRISIRFPRGFNVSQATIAEGSDHFRIGPAVPCGTDCRESSELLSLVYVTQTSVPRGDPTCDDDISFTDRWGYDCAHWNGRNCFSDEFYTEENLKDIRNACSLTCQVCTLPVRVSLGLKLVRNRIWAGHTGPFELRLLNSDGTFTREENLNVSGIVLMPGVLENPSVRLSDVRTGSNNSALIEFTLSDRNQWPADGKLSIEFPVRIRIGALSSCMTHPQVCDFRLSLLSSDLAPEDLSMTDIQGQILILQRLGDQDNIPIKSAIQVRIPVTNENSAGITEGFLARTLTRAGFEIDNVRLPGVQLAPGNLTNTSVQLFDPTAYAFTDAKVCFRFGFVGLPRQSLISIVFPSAHFTEEASLGQFEGLCVFGDCSMLIEGSRILLSVSEASPPFTFVCLVFQGIRNYFAGPTDHYQIVVSPQSRIGIMEQHLFVTSNFIVPAKLGVDRFEPSSSIAGEEINLLLGITIKGALNFANTAGGRIVIELPAGSSTVGIPRLDILDVQSSKMLGNWELKVIATNVSLFPVHNFDLPSMPCQSLGWLTCGSGMILELLGAFEWPAGTSITFKLNGIRNRPFDGTANFRIFTTDLTNRLSDLISTLHMTLVPNNMHTMTIRPQSILTNSSSHLVFSFSPKNAVPPDCDLRVTIPAGYSVAFRRVNYQLVQQIDIAFSTMDGNLAVLGDIQHAGANAKPLNFTVRRRRGTLMSPGSNVTFSIFGLTSRFTSGSTGSFSIVLQTLNGNIIEQNRSVPGFHLKYAHPGLKHTRLANSPCMGKADVTLVGSNFGHMQTNEHLEAPFEQRSTSLGWSSCHKTTWISDSTIMCSAAPGVSESQAVITIEQQTATLSGAFTYDSALIKHALRSNLIYAHGSQIFGYNLQSFDHTGRMRIGVTSAESTMWQSDTAVMCSTAKSISRSQSLQITLREIVGSLTESISFDFSHLIVQTTNTRSKSSTAIQVDGFKDSNILTQTARLGLSACESTHWISVTVVLCKVPPSIGQSLHVSITSGNCVASSTNAFSADHIITLQVSKSTVEAATLSWDSLNAFVGQMHSLRVRIGRTKSQETRWLSTSAVLCNLATGSGLTLAVVLTVGQTVQSATEVFSYFGSLISGLAKSNAAHNSIAIMLHVVSMDMIGNSLKGRMGVSACEAMEWRSSTAMTCMSVRQQGVSLSSVITAGHAVGTISHAISLDTPTGVLPHNSATKLDQSMIIRGFGFGYASISLSLRLGISGAEASSWTSHTVLWAKPASSLAASTRVCVTSGKNAGTMSEVFSFDIAHPSRISFTNGAVLKTIVMYMTAMHPASFSPAGRIGRSAWESSTWTSDTALNCKTGGHIHKSLALVVTAGSLMRTVTQGLSYDSLNIGPTISSSNTALVCKISLTSAYVFLLHSMRLRVGGSADESSAWTGLTSITCKIGQHTTRSLRLLVTAGSSSSSTSETLSYDLVSPLRTTRHANMLHWKLGSNISLSSYSSAYRIGDSVLEKTEWIAETTIWCHWAAGTGGSLRLVMTIGAGFTGGSETMALSYHEVAPSLLSANLPCSRGQKSSFAVYGLFFGRFDCSATAAFGTSAEASQWVSDSVIQCKSGPSIRSSLSIKISSGIQIGSITNVCSHDLSSMIAVVRGNRHVSDTGKIVILSQSLGTEQYSMHVSIGGTSSRATEWESMSSLRCKAARGIASSHSLVLTTQIRAGTLIQILSFDTPCISRLQFSNHPAYDGAGVPMVGALFGFSTNSASARMGLTVSRSTNWLSGTSLVAFCSPGLSVRLTAIVSVGQKVGSHSRIFSYDSPVIRNALKLSTNIPKAGVVLNLPVLGQNFGVSDYSPEAVAGLTSCEASLWHSDSSISCYAPHGTQAHSVDLLIAIIQDIPVSAKVSMTYDSPMLSSREQSNVKSTGLEFINVFGTTFGVSSNTQQCAVGISSAEATKWLADSSCLCRLTQGTEMSRQITLTTVSLIGSASEAVSFDASLHLPRHSNGASGSISHMVLHPAFFVSVRARIGRTACQATRWFSASSLFCKSSGLSGSSVRFVITEGIKSGTLREMFSSDALVLEPLRLANATRNLAARASMGILVASQIQHIGLSSFARLGVTACENTIWNSLTAVRCQPASTHESSKSFILTAGMKISSVSEVWSIDSMVVDVGAFLCSGTKEGAGASDIGAGLSHGQLRSVRGAIDVQELTSNLPSWNAGSMVAIATYGAVVQSVSARNGNTACEKSLWMSFTSLQCQSSKRTTGSMVLAITAGMQSGSTSAGYSWDVAFISALASRNSIGVLSSSVFLLAAGFSPSFQTFRGIVGLTACHSTKWQSASSILCHSIRVSGGSRIVGITVFECVNTLTESFTIDKSAVGAALQENLPGGSKLRALIVTMKGSSFGLSDNSLIARTSQTGCEATVWKLDTSVIGLKWRMDKVGATAPIIVTAGLRSESLTEAFSTDLRVVSALLCTNAPSHASTGHSLFHMLLERMESSSRDVSLASRAGLTNCEITTWTSQTSIACRSFSAWSATRQISLTSGRGVSSLTQMHSFDKPHLSSAVSRTNVYDFEYSIDLDHAYMFDHAVFQGNVAVWTDLSPSVRIAMTACEVSYWLSSTSVVSRVAAGSGRSHHIALTFGLQVGSMSNVISFDVAKVFGIEAKDSSPTSLILSCAMLGYSDMSPSLRIQGTSCVETRWRSESSVLCSIPPQVSRNNAIQITVCQSVGTISYPVKFRTPSLSSALPANRPKLRKALMLLFGSMLGLSSQSSWVRLGLSSAESTAWRSDSSMSVSFGAGEQRSTDIALTIVSRISSFSGFFSYDKPTVSHVSRANLPCTANTIIQLLGLNMGAYRSSHGSRLGGTEQEAGSWVSDTSISALYARGKSFGLALTITASRQVSSLLQAISLDTASIRKSASNLPMYAIGSFGINGTGFGILSVSPVVRLGATSCMFTLWLSDTSVSCRHATGVGRQQSVVISQGHSSASISHALSYDVTVLVDFRQLRNFPLDKMSAQHGVFLLRMFCILVHICVPHLICAWIVMI
jgi:hypothetical protein